MWASSIAARVLAYCAEDPQFETHFEPRVERSLTARPAANGDLAETLGEVMVARKGTGYPTP